MRVIDFARGNTSASEWRRFRGIAIVETTYVVTSNAHFGITVSIACRFRLYRLIHLSVTGLTKRTTPESL